MAQITFQIDDDDFSQLEDFCKETGFTKEVLMNVYAKKIISTQQIPFQLGILKAQNNKPVTSFDFLQDVDGQKLADILKDQPDFIIAVVLSQIPSNKSCALLKVLSTEKATKVIKLISQELSVSNKIIDAVADFVFNCYNNSEKQIRLGNTDKAAEILGSNSRLVEKSIIENMKQVDSELAEEIKKRIFVFDDIVMISDRDIQKVLREADQQQMAKALKNVDPEVQDKVFRNMSKRQATMLQEDMEYMGPVRLSDVEEAQERIVAIIRRLEDSGEIVIARDAGDELI